MKLIRKIKQSIRQRTRRIRRNLSNVLNFWRRRSPRKLAFARYGVNNQELASYQQHAIKEVNAVELSTIQLIIIIACATLLLLPFVTTFNEFVTRFVMKIEVYRLIQDQITPYLVKIVTGLLNFLQINSIATFDRIYMYKGSEPISVFISWNCIGWQSIILLFITLFIGLKGPFTLNSKIETVLIGILGTILINIFRISFVSIIAYYFGQMAAIIFHDYVSTLIIILWLVAYWLFSYRFILHHKDLVKVNHR